MCRMVCLEVRGMRLKWLDAVGTSLVGMIVGLYVVWQAVGDVPIRGLAVIALALGATAHVAIGPVTRVAGRLRTFARISALVVVGLGVATVASDNGELLLAFIAAIVVLWLVAMLNHGGLLQSGDAEPVPTERDDLLGEGDPRDDARTEWERNRPGPFVPPPSDPGPLSW
jgi:hypothetical protein